MKKLSRRKFGKVVAGAALASPAAVQAALTTTQEPPRTPAASAQPPQSGPPPLEPRVKMTAEQEEAVKQAVQRRERQLATLRNFKLDYSAEPAFVFRAKK